MRVAIRWVLLDKEYLNVVLSEVGEQCECNLSNILMLFSRYG